MMADVKTPAVSEGQAKPAESQEIVKEGHTLATHDESETAGDADESKETQSSPDKDKELPEPIRPGDGKGMMPGLPPINISDLKTVLCAPNMPAQKIMKEVADKMLLKSEESESDDGSVGSSGGGMGMKGLFDCIVEVSLLQSDSDNSDDDDDPVENVPREIPCTFCSKIFESSMKWKTHVLVAHPQQDPSVLNIKRLSGNEAREKGHPAHRKRSKGSSKSDCDITETKSRHPSKTDSKATVEIPQGEENMPVSKRRASLSRSQQKGAIAGKPEHKSRQAVQQVTKELLSSDKGDSILPSVESTGEGDSSRPEGVHGAIPVSPIGSTEKTKQSTPSSQKRKHETTKDQSHEEVIDLSVSANPPTSETKPSEEYPAQKKRKTASSCVEESSSSSSISSSQDPQNVSQSSGTKEAAGQSASGPERKRKHSDTPASEMSKKDKGRRSKGDAEKTSSVPKRRSARHL